MLRCQLVEPDDPRRAPSGSSAKQSGARLCGVLCHLHGKYNQCMAAGKRVTNRSKVALSPTELERAIVRIATSDPSLVATEQDGHLSRGVVPASMLAGLVPATPLKSGAPTAIDPAVVREEWASAVSQIRRNSGRVTLEAVATRLAISPETAKRYRKRYNLPL